MLLFLKCVYNYVLKYCCFLNRNEGGLELNIFFFVFKCLIIFFCFIERCIGKDFIIYNFQIVNVFDDDSNDFIKGNLWFNLNFQIII